MKVHVEAYKKPTVFGFAAIDNDADSSPACLKLETFLKMCGVDFDTRYFVEHQLKGGGSNAAKRRKVN